MDKLNLKCLLDIQAEPTQGASLMQIGRRKKKEKNPLRSRYFLETNTGRMWEEGIGETQYQMKGVEPLYCKCEERHSPFRVNLQL